MNKSKYVGLDVHQSSTSIAVLDESGKLCMERIIETRVLLTIEKGPTPRGF